MKTALKAAFLLMLVTLVMIVAALEFPLGVNDAAVFVPVNLVLTCDNLAERTEVSAILLRPTLFSALAWAFRLRGRRRRRRRRDRGLVIAAPRASLDAVTSSFGACIHLAMLVDVLPAFMMSVARRAMEVTFAGAFRIVRLIHYLGQVRLLHIDIFLDFSEGHDSQKAEEDKNRE